MNTNPEFSIGQIVRQHQALGVSNGDVLLVHSSFRSLRPVEGGPLGVIEALSQSLGPSGTLVMPSWTGDNDAPFDPAVTAASVDLGVVPDSFWRLPNAERGIHPYAFAARGPRAAEILADPFVLPAHQMKSPVGRVFECDGKILLLGVDHDSNTTIHLAELLAGVPYRRPKHITVLEKGQPKRIDYLENDHCCQRFRLANSWLEGRGLQSTGPVGHAPSILMRSRDLVAAIVQQLERNPVLFLHPNGSGCDECEDAWRSVTAAR